MSTQGGTHNFFLALYRQRTWIRVLPKIPDPVQIWLRIRSPGYLNVEKKLISHQIAPWLESVQPWHQDCMVQLCVQLLK
jgi:hypothetical protein